MKWEQMTPGDRFIHQYKVPVRHTDGTYLLDARQETATVTRIAREGFYLYAWFTAPGKKERHMRIDPEHEVLRKDEQAATEDPGKG